MFKNNDYNGIVHTAEMYISFKRKIDIQQIKNYFEYNSITEDKSKIHIKAQGINITYLKESRVIFIKMDFIKILGKPNINEQDINNIYKIIYKFIDEDELMDNPLRLTRFDFRLDVKIKDKETIDTIFDLYKKCRKKLYGMESNNKKMIYYKSKSKNFSKSIIIYDKTKERIEKKQEVQSYENNIIRYEIQIRKRHLKYNNYKKGMDRYLETYLNKQLFIDYFTKYIFKIVYVGNFYNINNARKIIKQNIPKVKKQEELIKALITISRGSIDTLEKKGYSLYKRNEILRKLEELGINPILIPKNKNISYIENPIYEFYKQLNQ